jgi:glucose-6-phosphate isomerase
MSSHADILFEFDNMMAEGVGKTGVKTSELDALKPQLKIIFDGLTDLRKLGQLPFRDLPYHDDITEKVLKKAKEVREKFESILLLGTGGSSLGASFVASALGDRKGPELIVCDHLDASEWKRIASLLKPEKTLVVAVSKSGKTLETLAAFFFFRERFKHGLIITDPHEGPLRKIASEEKLDSFDIPPGVGGRFSVLTAAGLFPAACVGVDIQQLLEGARKMDERCKNADLWSNPALMSASLHYLADVKHHRKIRVIMPYGERLKGYAPWFAQLWAESLGKKMSLAGKEIFAGSTPVCAVGPQDQHSQLQLYLDGPHDKTVTFIGVENDAGDMNLSSDLGMKSVHQLLEAGRKATEAALTEASRPNQTLLLKELNAHAVGQLLYMAEAETVFAGELYNVNPFDQPAVEKIKQKIQSFLKK